MLRDPTSDKWRKYWAVLRRPYLHLYESSSEAEEVTVINLSTVRVEQSPEIEQMLEVRCLSVLNLGLLLTALPRQRRFSFAIFTHQNRFVYVCGSWGAPTDYSFSQLLLPGTELEGDARLDQEHRPLPRYMIPRSARYPHTHTSPHPYARVLLSSIPLRLSTIPRRCKYST